MLKSHKTTAGILLLLLLFNCSVSSVDASGFLYNKKKKKNTVVQGRVIGRIDKNTENSIVGARVKIYTLFRKRLAGSAASVENGKYKISAKLNGFYYLTATSVNYKAQTKLAYLKKGNIYSNVDFKLYAKSPATIPSDPPTNPYNAAPVITSITPENNSEFLAGTKIKISIDASDADKDKLQYKFSVGRATKQNWSSASTYLWQTSSADKGTVGITCEASDNKGGKAYNTITCRIIDPTTEEILHKLSDNHAKVYDFSADMLLNVTLNGEALDKPQYCRYYFKAPQKTPEHKSESKEKTETYENSSRGAKTNIIIIDGKNMSLINPQNEQVQTIDILEESEISSSQINQMDIYYDTANFLAGHTVVKNTAKTDFDKKLICLEARPNEKNKFYTKLELIIDYNKGILTKNTLYNKDTEDSTAVEQWVQTIETTESQQMPNGAWLPIKMTKIPNLSSGKMESKLEYSNLSINTGLKDEDFNPQKQL
ncbi:MAG: hypothetical protein ABIH18_07180 [Candidatus Omnitrophota bacterium]